MTVPDLISKYEVPAELHDALWEAYQEGVKRGFIAASIENFNATNNESDLIKKFEESMSRLKEAKAT